VKRALFTLAVLLLSAHADAQYFGRNKVQYDSFAFAVMQTPHFDIYYYASEEAATRIAAELAERWYARLSAIFDRQLSRRQPIILYASHAQFASTSVVPDVIGDGVGGFTDGFAGRVVMPFAAGLGETDHVLGHELVHVFQREILKSRGRSMSMLPLWFTEGMAEYFSVGALDPNTEMWLRDTAATGTLPSIAELGDARWFPYRYGQALWQYIADTYGQAAVVKALRSRAKGGVNGRLRDATGRSVSSLSGDWHAAIVADAKARAHEADGAALHPLVGGREGRGHINVAPSLSPDGERMVFLSERDGFSIDVFLADAHTGRVIRKLLNAATDPHFDSLQFIDSAGAWSADGSRFALATLVEGHPALTIFDMPRGEVRQEIAVAGVDQIFSPTWSPDGSRIAFSALEGGFADLFYVDVAGGELHALTSDPYSDLQPAWSPDGRTIAFATDRYSSSLESLSFGPYSLASLDVESKAVTLLGGYPDTKNIDPHWSSDGATLYFVSDEGRVSNLHALDVASGRMTRVTDVGGGVTGITALSPSVSIAAHGASAAVSLYARGSYQIASLDLTVPAASRGGENAPDSSHASEPSVANGGAPEAANASPASIATAGTSSEAAETSSEPAQASAARGSGSADAMKGDGGGAAGPASRLAPIRWPASSRSGQNASDAVPGSAHFASKPYASRLSLVQIGTPYLSAGGGAFGSFLRAGISMSFGDMLGQQELGTAVQVGKQSTDNAFQIIYANRRSRWNWGLSGGRVPALVGLTESIVPSDAEAGAIVRRLDLFEQVHREVTGTLAYPFSRAKRFEATLGLDAITFDDRATVSTYSAVGARLDESSSTRPNLPAATIVQTGAALVYDTAIFGPTSPILGQRYRFGLASSFGDIRVVTAVADYRRYLMPLRPFTLALRLQGVARMGGQADDPRLLPLVWNMRDLVRGFDTDAETIRTTRYALGNVELRFPLAAAVGRATSSLPLEGLAFADCGAFGVPALRDASSAARGLCSAGGGVRLNAAGFVFEFDAVRPIGVPRSGWRLGVNFLPGF
jgi:hypothetical protein